MKFMTVLIVIQVVCWSTVEVDAAVIRKQHRHRRHRRNLSQLQNRHAVEIQNMFTPIDFNGKLEESRNLSPEDRSVLFQNLHNYIVKHAPGLVTSDLPSLPGIGRVDEDSKISVAVSRNPESRELEIQQTIDSRKLSKLAKEKIEMALTPQYAILKKKQQIAVIARNP